MLNISNSKRSTRVQKKKGNRIMKIMIDYQVELATIEELTSEEFEKAVAKHGSVENFVKEAKEAIEKFLGEECEGLNHNISIKAKAFVLEK